MVSGTSPDGRLVEAIELPNHPYFIATQFHPEFQSRPNRPHPLFQGLIKAALDLQGDRLANGTELKANLIIESLNDSHQELASATSA